MGGDVFFTLAREGWVGGEGMVVSYSPKVSSDLTVVLTLGSPRVRIVKVAVIYKGSPIRVKFKGTGGVLGRVGHLSIPICVKRDAPLEQSCIGTLSARKRSKLKRDFLPRMANCRRRVDTISFLTSMLGGRGMSVVRLTPVAGLTELVRGSGRTFSYVRRVISVNNDFGDRKGYSPITRCGC